MGIFSRRRFLTAVPSGLLGLGLSGKVRAGSRSRPVSPAQEEPPRIRKYKPLGKTGLKISDVSCGAISFFEPTVLRYAYDLGVNYFDTAESYMGGQSEKLLGEALKEVRDKVIITTKHPYSSRQKITRDSVIGRVEESLKRLQTDYVDFALIHQANDLAILQNEELLSAYARLKKEGKVRFTGFSTHNPKLTLKQALGNDFVQQVLVIYNHLEGKEIEPLIRDLRSRGTAVVAMKIFAGGKQGSLKSLVSQKLSYPQAAIRWVMSNPDIDTCIPTMSSYSHVEEYVAASGQPLEREDLEVIAAYRRSAGNKYCRVSCSECLSACPGNVAVNDVLRYKMYFEDYGIEKEAMRFYAGMEEERKPLACASCSGPCERACPYGLKVRESLIQAHRLLSA